MTQFLKTCTKCRKQKHISRFSKRKKAKDSLQSHCKDCNIISVETRSPEDKREDQLKTKFGITLKDYELMLKSQNGVCAICGQSETVKHQNGEIKRLAVDHNHDTNKIRELLCFNCNHILGKAKENIKILESAIKYLKKHQ